MKPPLSARVQWLLAAWCIALFACCLTLHLRHRDFAWFYHPDEGSKVEQVLTGQWNFHHPMLLVRVAKIVATCAQSAPTPQAVVEWGRASAAGLTALAVVALSLLAYVWRGWPAAIAAGVALSLHHQLYELSHYMKEDSALLLGMSLTWLALLLFEQAPSAPRAAALGLAAALAISGKYIGVIVLLAIVPTLWRAKSKSSAVVFFIALIAGLLVVNWPLVSDLDGFRQSLARETALVVSGQRGTTRSVPHAQYWNIFIDNTTPAIWVLLIIFLVARYRSRRGVSMVRWQIIAFPFLFAVALSFSPKSNDRYFLPATAIFTMLAGIGVADTARLFGRRWLVWPAGAALVGCQLFSLPPPHFDWRTYTEYAAAFQHDDSRALLDWCRAELPANAVISKDSRVWLPDPAKPNNVPAGAIPQKVLAAKFAADFGTLEEQRAKGVTHIAVSESDYGRFALKSLQPKKGQEKDYARRKAFYESLLREGELLFERERGTVIYLHPGIRVYRIAGA